MVYYSGAFMKTFLLGEARGSGMPYKIILFVSGVTPKASMNGTVCEISVGLLAVYPRVLFHAGKVLQGNV